MGGLADGMPCDHSVWCIMYSTIHSVVCSAAEKDAGPTFAKLHLKRKARKLTGSPLASLTFLKRSPLGASSMARCTWPCVRKTSLNLMTFG